MPEFLTDALQSLRQTCDNFATATLIPAQDTAPGEARAGIRAASKAAGLFSMTQPKEFGGTAALPIWIDFMREALRDKPEVSRPLPPGIVHVKIDPDTGLLAASRQRNAIFEYFREEYVPGQGAEQEGPGSGSQGTEDLVRDIF